MNRTQREEVLRIFEDLDGIRARVEEIRDEEQEKYDNLPENFQDGEKGERFQEGIDALEEVLGDLESATDKLQEIGEGI